MIRSVDRSDAPWMTDHLKSLIQKRQKAFHKYGVQSTLLRFYRNMVNRERRACKGNFYKSKVEHAKKEDPKRWWKEVKRLLWSPVSLGRLEEQHSDRRVE